MRLTLLLSPLAIVLCNLATAQTAIFVPDQKIDAGRCTSLPFGSYSKHSFAKNQKYQTLVTWDQLRGLARPVVEEIGFAACASGVHRFDSISIRMGQTSNASLSADFASNLGTNPTTVLASTNYYWHHQKDQWSHIGLQVPFQLVAGKNLVIDIEVRGAVFLAPGFGPATETGSFRMAENLPRLYAIDWATSPPAKGVTSPYGLKLEVAARAAALGTFGIGCKGAGTTSPTLTLDGKASPGGTVNVHLSGALGQNPAILVLGFNSRPPFPVALGFAGCSLYESLDLVLTATTDPNGALVVPVPLPNSAALRDQRFYTQFFQVELANRKFGLRSSNYGRVLID